MPGPKKQTREWLVTFRPPAAEEALIVLNAPSALAATIEAVAQYRRDIRRTSAVLAHRWIVSVTETTNAD